MTRRWPTWATCEGWKREDVLEHWLIEAASFGRWAKDYARKSVGGAPFPFDQVGEHDHLEQLAALGREAIDEIDPNQAGNLYLTGRRLHALTRRVREVAELCGVSPAPAYALARDLAEDHGKRMAQPNRRTLQKVDACTALVDELFARPTQRPAPRAKREPSDAVELRKAERRAWVLSVLRSRKKRPSSVSALHRLCVEDARQSISRQTVKRDLLDAVQLGELSREQAEGLV